MKKILCNTLIIIFMLGVFCNGYFGFSGLSFSDRVSFAEADNWSSCDSSDLVTAFRYYCKSRNLALEGSVADALTTFTTNTFNNICSTLGIDPTALQSELKKTTEGNLGLRYLFSNTGITAYNRIFAEFLQNNDLAVGDSVEDETIYNGSLFTDADGNTCFVYIISAAGSWITSSNITFGTPYKYDGYSYMKEFYPNGINTANSTNSTTTWHLTAGNTASVTKRFFSNDSVDGTSNLYGVGGTNGLRYNTLIALSSSNNSAVRSGSFCVYVYNNMLYFGTFCRRSLDGKYYFTKEKEITDSNDLENSDITITTNNNTINNNEYNNNYTIIYNDGDTYITDDDDEPQPTTPPGIGGEPDTDDPLEPYDPTKPFPDTPDNPTPDPGVHGSPGSDGTITIPDFNFDLPDIDWSLDGLQHKFPFSLPFDLYNACKLLNAEPQTPELDYTVDLVVYQWPVQMDLHWLDPAARVIRIFELLAFVVGLILITRHLIGG